MNVEPGPAFTRAQSVVSGPVAALPSIFLALVVFGAFFVLAAIVKSVVARLTETRLQAHRNAGVAIGRLAQGLVLFVGLLIAQSVALPSFKPGDVVQVLGISSVAIGFAFRDIHQNFLARASGSSSLNHFEHRRLEYDIGIGYGDDVDHARSVILNPVRSTEAVLAEPAPDVLLTQQGLFHDQTEDGDGDRSRQREGGPAGQAEVPAARKVADAIAQISRAKPGGVEGK